MNSHGVYPLYLTIADVDGSIKQKNGNKYLTFTSTDKNKEVLEKYTELWDGIKSLIEKINNKPGKYGKDYMKIKFNSDNNWPLNKLLTLHMLTVIVRSVFQEVYILSINIIHNFFT